MLRKLSLGRWGGCSEASKSPCPWVKGTSEERFFFKGSLCFLRQISWIKDLKKHAVRLGPLFGNALFVFETGTLWGPHFCVFLKHFLTKIICFWGFPLQIFRFFPSR